MTLTVLLSKVVLIYVKHTISFNHKTCLFSDLFFAAFFATLAIGGLCCSAGEHSACSGAKRHQVHVTFNLNQYSSLLVFLHRITQTLADGKQLGKEVPSV